jgi:hypothetical protein
MTAVADLKRPTVEEAEADYREALSERQRVEARERELRTAGATDDAGFVLDALTREVLLAGLADDKLRTATRVLDAKARLEAARLDRANALLPELVADHSEAVAGVVAAVETVETTYAAFVAAMHGLGEAAAAERDAARLIVSATNGTSAHERVRLNSRDEVPTEIGATGATATVARPTLHLFGVTREEMNPAADAFYVALGKLARMDRQRASGWMSDALRAAVEAS